MVPLAALHPPWPQPRHFVAAASLWSLFVVYGSLTPFHFEPLAWSEAARYLQWILAQPLTPASRGDWVTNVLLLVPFGIAGLGACLLDQDQPLRRWLGVGLVLTLGLVLSSTVELAQLWFPPRYPSTSDVLAQLIGNCLGMGCWLAIGQQLVGWLRRRLSAGPTDRTAVLLQVYVAGLLLFSLLPLDLTIRPGDLWDKVQAGQVILVPFANWSWQSDHLRAAVIDGAAMWPLGMLLALWPSPGQAPRLGLVLRWLLAIGGVTAIELAQLIVRSRYCETTDVIVGSIGASFGMGSTWLWLRAGTHARLWLTVGGLAGVLLLLVFAYLLPDESVIESSAAFARLRGMVRVPLEILRHGEPLAMLVNVTQKLCLFGIFGWLVGELVGPLTNASVPIGKLIVSGILAGLLLSASIEVAQSWLPPHVPDVTDIVWGAVGGGLGVYLGLCGDSREAEVVANRGVDEV